MKAIASDVRRRVLVFLPDRVQNRTNGSSVFRRVTCKNEESAFQKAFKMTRGFKMMPSNHLKDPA